MIRRGWLTLLLGLICHVAAIAETISGRVVSIADGDTLTLLQDRTNQQIKVRLAEIDAPEKKQPFGQASRQALADAVFQKVVRVDVIGIDKYGRSIGRILLGGDDINRRQIRTGHAWEYREYLATPEYLDEEERARTRRLGLWADRNPVPPWDWRAEKRRN